ncbi:MAG: glycosyltransferase family 2 protein [Alphaproteobacteria bacterium]|nr:glycosyltransferase family 2 protein [Alphaproteobacteria bacterium]
MALSVSPPQPSEKAPAKQGKQAPDVSVILCTRNRAALLSTALEQLTAVIRNNPDVRVELIIVNNGSRDNTADVIAAFARGHTDFPVRAIDALKPGLAAARNAGLKVGLGRILMFCDDDGVLAPDYFTVLLRLYANAESMTMIGGCVLLGNKDDLPYTIKTETEPAVYNGRYPGGFIHGCNMTFSRTIYETIGLMDERFGAGALFPSADESDYIHRAHKAGATVRYCPDLIAYHFHGRRDPAEVRRLFDGYMIGDGALYAKHWNNGLLRCLIGNIVNAVRSLYKAGHVFDKTLGFSYYDAALGNLRGFVSFWLKG